MVKQVLVVKYLSTPGFTSSTLKFYHLMLTALISSNEQKASFWKNSFFVAPLGSALLTPSVKIRPPGFTQVQRDT